MLRHHWLMAGLLAVACSESTPRTTTGEQPPTPPTLAAPEPTAPASTDAGLVLAPPTPSAFPAAAHPRLQLPDPGAAAAAQGIRAPQNDAPPSPMLKKPYVPAPKLDSRGRGPVNRLDPSNPSPATVPPLGPSYGNAPTTDR